MRGSRLRLFCKSVFGRSHSLMRIRFENKNAFRFLVCVSGSPVDNDLPLIFSAASLEKSCGNTRILSSFIARELS
jgi:hypothetical protein